MFVSQIPNWGIVNIKKGDLTMQNVTLNVQGMSCGHCVNSIEGNVGKLNGVDSVKVHLSEGKVDVTFDSTILSLNEITEVIEEQGYEVENGTAQGESCH